jgi:hypothetical protein
MSNYATVDELKGELHLSAGDTVDDTRLADVLTTVSTWIEDHCRQRFWTTDKDEVRYFQTADHTKVWTGPLISVTELATDDDGTRSFAYVWTTADYDLTPYNSALDSRPYYWIETTPSGVYLFPLYGRGVRVTGKFGWSAVPAVVKRACLMQAIRFFKRPDAPFGMVGSAEMGYSATISQLDPDVARLLDRCKV